ncbi:MAG: hypothetical protein IIA44_12510 [Acidobacteria bacterium]|nr:hypothetical protein [Acidobacteriota bacterium]
MGLVACSDEEKTEDFAVTGQVLDAAGNAAAGAMVIIQFAQDVVTTAGRRGGEIPVTGPADVGDSTCYEVTDRCGRFVAQFTCLKEQVCSWDEHGLQGQWVPPGLYLLDSEDCESREAVGSEVTFVDYDGNPAEFFFAGVGMQPLAVTGADGRFAIRRCDVPIGVEFDCSEGTCMVALDVVIWAWKDDKRGSSNEEFSSSTAQLDVTVQLSDK